MPRDHDETRLLEALVWRSPLSRRELGERLGLGRTRLASLVEALVAEGLVASERAGTEGRIGRPARGVSLRLDAGLLVGVDLAPDGVVVTLCDANLEALGRRRLDAGLLGPVGPLMAAISRTISSLVRDAGTDPDAGRVLGIGVTVPSPVDRRTGLLVAPPDAPHWEGFGFAEHLGGAFPGAAVAVENDGTGTAIGHLWLERRAGGDADDLENVVVVKIGPGGLGAGLVVDGAVRRGAHGGAGEIGHVAPVPGEGRACSCGRRGCVQANASPAALLERAREALAEGRAPILRALVDGREPGLADLGRAVREGDPDIDTLVADAGARIGWALATLANVLDPQEIVIYGRMAELGPLLLGHVRRAIGAMALPIASRGIEVRALDGETEAAARGALVLAASGRLGLAP